MRPNQSRSLNLSSVTNGKLAVRAYKNAEKKTGLDDLSSIIKHKEGVKMQYKDLQKAPHRYHSSPVWAGLMNNDRAYAPYTYNVEKSVPWRTLTGRQHSYLDHEMYIAYGEHLPTYKPSPKPEVYGDLRETVRMGGGQGSKAVLLPSHLGRLGHYSQLQTLLLGYLFQKLV